MPNIDLTVHFDKGLKIYRRFVLQQVFLDYFCFPKTMCVLLCTRLLWQSQVLIRKQMTSIDSKWIRCGVVSPSKVEHKLSLP